MEKILVIRDLYYTGEQSKGFKIKIDPETEFLAIISKEDFEKIPSKLKPNVRLRYVFDTAEEQAAFVEGARVPTAAGLEMFGMTIDGSPRPVEGYKGIGLYSVETFV